MKWDRGSNGWTCGNYRIAPAYKKPGLFALHCGTDLLMYCGNFGTAVYEAQKHQRQQKKKGD